MLTGSIRIALCLVLSGLAANMAHARGNASTVALTDGAAQYELTIDVPEGPAPPHGWPVVYVLDGNAYATTMTAAVRTQAFAPDWTGMSDAVVVGIDRAGGALFDQGRHDDFTQVAHVDHVRRDGGHAESFYRLLTGPVRAAVAMRAPIDPTRQILFGHSLGGLFVLFALMHHTDSFAAYIASSPSIWWSAKTMRSDRPATERHIRAMKGRVSLFMSVGQWEARPGPDAQSAPGLADRRDTLHQSAMVANARETAHWLTGLRLRHLRVRFDVLAGEDHMSAPFIAIAHGARFALKR